MGTVEEIWFDKDGETTRVVRNGRTVRQVDLEQGKHTITDELGEQIVKKYDSRDNLIKEEFSDGSSKSYQYDSHNELVKKTDELDRITLYRYNQQGLVTRIRKAAETFDEQMTDISYDKDGDPLTITNYKNGTPVVTTFSYDEKGNPVTATDALGDTTRYQYDYLGDVIKVTNPVGLVATMDYDSKGHLLAVHYPGGRTISYTYDAADRPISKKDNAGGATSLTYDYQDNVTSVQDALGGIARYSYDLDNRLTKRIDQEGKYTIYFHDAATGLVNKVIDGAGNTIEVTYRGFDDCGTCPKTFSNKPVQITYPTFTRMFRYDTRGRVIRQSDIDGKKIAVTTMSYDKAGRLIAETDAQGGITQRKYDNLDRLVAETDPADGVTRYKYDQLGNLVTVTDATGGITTYAYDLLGRKIKEVRPSGATLRYTYDAAGRLATETDSLGHQVVYIYSDTTGRLAGYMVKKTPIDPPAKIVHFSYDKQGHLTGYDDGLTKGSYSYDMLGRLIAEKTDYGTFTASDSTTYYQNGLMKSFTGPDGLTAHYRYNAINRISAINIDGVGSFNYGAYRWLRPRGVALPTGTRLNHYDGLMRLTTRQDTIDSTKVLDLGYSYNGIGNITQRKTPQQTTDYGYDSLSRLTEVKNNGKLAEKFSYDPIGNRLSSLPDKKYSYQNSLLTAADGTSYGYDKNGSTTSITRGATTTTLHYNLENRLAEISSKGVTAQYFYDPFGQPRRQGSQRQTDLVRL